jgi:hypothetical protein
LKNIGKEATNITPHPATKRGQIHNHEYQTAQNVTGCTAKQTNTKTETKHHNIDVVCITVLKEIPETATRCLRAANT